MTTVTNLNWVKICLYRISPGYQILIRDMNMKKIKEQKAGRNQKAEKKHTSRRTEKGWQQQQEEESGTEGKYKSKERYKESAKDH